MLFALSHQFYSNGGLRLRDIYIYQHNPIITDVIVFQIKDYGILANIFGDDSSNSIILMVFDIRKKNEKETHCTRTFA